MKLKHLFLRFEGLDEKKRHIVLTYCTSVRRQQIPREIQTKGIMAALKSQMGLKESRMWHAREKERVFQVVGHGVCPKGRTQSLWTV